MSNYVHQAVCPTCGPVRIISKEITLYLHPSIPELGTYEFRCPGCYDLVVKATSTSIISHLQGAGVRSVDLTVRGMTKALNEWSSLIHGTEDLFAAITEGR